MPFKSCQALVGAMLLSTTACVVAKTTAAVYVGTRLLPIADHQYATSKTADQYLKNKIFSPIVEFDDAGMLRDPHQLSAALRTLRDSAKHHRVVTIVYVHGWDHTADADDENLHDVNDLARSLTDTLNKLDPADHDSTWAVVPIYMGWRGKNWLGEPAWWNLALPYVWQASTFWDRKASAERIGLGGLGVALSQISAQWKTWRLSDDPTERQNSLVIVGHSFGGAAVLSATIPWVLSGLQVEKAEREARLLATTVSPAGSPARSPTSHESAYGAPTAAPGAADLVIAVNPATEAMMLDNTVFSPTTNFRSDATGVTRLLVLDAENDFPRGALFPLGRLVSQILNWHHFMAEHLAAGREDSQIGYRLFAPDSSTVTCTKYSTKDKRYPNGLVGYSVMDKTGKLGCVRNSVMVMRATDDDKVIDGHSGMWQPAVVDFLRAFIAEHALVQARAATLRQ